MKKGWIVVVCLLLAAGCANTIGLGESKDVYRETTVAKDDYSKVTKIKTPRLKDVHATGQSTYLLRALIQGPATIYQLYVTDYDYDWRFFDHAYDRDGNQLEFVEIDQSITSSGNTREDFAIGFDRAYLERRLDDGLDIKAIGDRGERVLVVPGFFVEGFLRRVDEVRE